MISSNYKKKCSDFIQKCKGGSDLFSRKNDRFDSEN